MITVLAIMSLGIILGVFIRNNTKWINANDKLTTWAIYLLLFLLGIRVGVNNTIINNLYSIGLQAIIITIGATLGSLIFAYIVYKLFFVPKKKNSSHYLRD